MTKNTQDSNPKRPQRQTQRDEDKRLRKLEREQRSAAMGQRAKEAAQTRTKAPLFVGAFALLMVLALVLWWWLNPAPQLTVKSLQSPVVAAQSAGDELYPANTEYAIQEVIKFGYLPEVPLTTTADGDLVLGPKAGEEGAMGLSGPVNEISTADFLGAQVESPTVEGFTSNPLTWDAALEKFGKSTVFIATVQDPETVAAMGESVDKHSSAEAVIVRSASLPALTAASQAGYAAMFAAPEGDTPAAAELTSAGVTMVEIPKDADLSVYQQADLKVWVTGVAEPAELTSLSEAGVFGALTSNPFTIQPSAVKTD